MVVWLFSVIMFPASYQNRSAARAARARSRWKLLMSHPPPYPPVFNVACVRKTDVNTYCTSRSGLLIFCRTAIGAIRNIETGGWGGACQTSPHTFNKYLSVMSCLLKLNEQLLGIHMCLSRPGLVCSGLVCYDLVCSALVCSSSVSVCVCVSVCVRV